MKLTRQERRVVKKFVTNILFGDFTSVTKNEYDLVKFTTAEAEIISRVLSNVLVAAPEKK